MTDDAHDRTRRLAEQLGLKDNLERLRSVRVAIELSPDAAIDAVAANAFLTAVNLATRLGPYLPRLHVRCPAVPAVQATPPLNGKTLLEQATKLAREATETAGLDRAPADDENYDLVIAIGPPTLSATHYLPLSWQGWRTHVGPIGPAPTSTPTGEVLAALVAAALAIAKLMAYMARTAQPKFEFDNTAWRLNPLTLDDSDFAIDPQALLPLPQTLLLGAGAIAVNFAYAAHYLPALIEAGYVLDRDSITKTNGNRHTTCLYEQAVPGTLAKVSHLAALLPLTAVEKEYDEWKQAGQGSAGDFPLLLTTVDNTEARRSAMSDLPKVTLDAATGGHGITLLRAADPIEACGLCAYPLAAVPAGPAGRGCGSADVAPALPGASVSYVSALAGFLLVGQAVMEATGAPTLRPGANIWHWDDLLQPPPGVAGFRTRRSSTCIARHALLSQVYNAKWNSKP